MPKSNILSADQSIMHSKSQWSEKDHHIIATLLMTGIAHSNFEFPTLMVLLAGLLTTISQIRYHFKAELLSFLAMINQNRVFEIQTNGKQLFYLVEEWNSKELYMSTEIVSFWHIRFVSAIHIFTQKLPIVMNEMS